MKSDWYIFLFVINCLRDSFTSLLLLFVFVPCYDIATRNYGITFLRGRPLASTFFRSFTYSLWFYRTRASPPPDVASHVSSGYRFWEGWGVDSVWRSRIGVFYSSRRNSWDSAIIVEYIVVLLYNSGNGSLHNRGERRGASAIPVPRHAVRFWYQSGEHGGDTVFDQREISTTS